MSLITDISNYQHLKRMSSYDNQFNAKCNSSSKGKEEWQKNALRVCGNWSEQLSSKGKVYFYNCLTEVSQWQKPVEWNLPDIDKRDLSRFIDNRKDSSKRNYFYNEEPLIASKKYRIDEDSSGDRSRKSLNGNKKVFDDMEISPHTSPSERFRRSNTNKSQPPSQQQQQPTTLKKLVDVLESLDNLLTTTNTIRNNNKNGNSPNSSNRTMFDSKRAPPPPPPPPLNNSCMNNKNSNRVQPQINSTGNGNANQKTVSNLTNTLNSLVSLLNQKSNKKNAKITPNSTPTSSKPSFPQKYEINQNHSENNFHGNHSSPVTNSRMVSSNNSNNIRNNLISPNRNFSPASVNNDNGMGASGDNLILRDGQAASYRDHRLQKQRNINDNLTSREPRASETECSAPEKFNNGINNNSNSDVFQPQLSLRNNDDIQCDGIDKSQQLYHRINSLLQSSDILKYTDKSLIDKFNDNQNIRLLTEISNEAKKFDQLHNVLYSELSCEMKKLRSLLLFSEVKLDCHEKKRLALNKLLEELETRKPLENKSFSDLIL